MLLPPHGPRGFGPVFRNKPSSEIRNHWLSLFFQEVVPWIESVTQIELSRLFLVMQFAVYRSSDYSNAHRDHSHPRRRAIAYVLNLSDFEPEEGGRLLLLRGRKATPGQIERRVPHRFNSFIFFEINAKSWHQIEPIRTSKKRLTLSGWLFHREGDHELKADLKRLKSKRCGLKI